MPICDKLKKYLDDNKIRYVVIAHSRAYTAQEIAASAHIKGKNLVKCVMVNGDGSHYMIATSANHKVNWDKLKDALNLEKVHLEQEDEFKALFEDCQVGAMPPFGNLYNIPVVADKILFEDDEIAFNGGNHTSVVKMSFADFEELVKPKKVDIAEPLWRSKFT